MNLTGIWKGSFRYGKGYPSIFIGKSEPFQLNLMDNDGILTGFCIDKIVTAFEGNESTIEGIFKDNYISFIKKYKFQAIIDESNNTVLADDSIKSDGIHYVGHSYKRFFRNKIYFEGEWHLTTEYIEGNEKLYHSVEGTWTMSKM